MDRSAWIKPVACIMFFSTLPPQNSCVAEPVSVRLQLRQVAGTRPFVPVSLNGIPFLFMVHANANFLAMTTHKNAREAGLSVMKSQDRYGITSAGHVSALGRTSATVKTLQVGADVLHNASIRVFEVPQQPKMDGMLGIQWLRSQKAVVDFAHVRLLIPQQSSDATRLRARLLREGYTAIPMDWDEPAGAFVVSAAMNGVSAPFRISTVASMEIDTPFAKQARIATGPVISTYGGPTGTTGENRKTVRTFTVNIQGVPARSTIADVFDNYAYEAKERPPAGSKELFGGTLGCSFMIANHAILDFGEAVLYLKAKRK